MGLSVNYRSLLNNLLDKHIELDYLKSTGVQYIDTGFIANQDTKVEMKYKMSQSKELMTSAVPIFGSRTNGTKNAYYFAIEKNGRLFFNYNTKYQYTTSINDLNEHIILYDKNYIYLDSNSITSLLYNNFSCPANMLLFGASVDGFIKLSSYLSIYYTKIWDNNTLIRDFIPVLKDGIPCMFDRVNNEYYYNEASNADFKYGYKTQHHNINSYVGKGLTCYVDGIKNIKYKHDTNILYWEDLSGNGYNLESTVEGNYINVSGEDSVYIDNNNSIYGAQSYVPECKTIEIVYSTDSTDGVLFSNVHENKKDVIVLLKQENYLILIIQKNDGSIITKRSINTLPDSISTVNSLNMYIDESGYYLNNESYEMTQIANDFALNITNPGISLGVNVLSNALSDNFSGNILALRTYNRKLTDEERLINYNKDKTRFKF